MRSSRPLSKLVALSFVALFAASGCSALLKWDNNNLPCDPVVKDGNTSFCFKGYSCQTQALRCVRDATLTEGETCTVAGQCKAGLTCPLDLIGGGGVSGENGVDTCLHACTDTGNDGGFLQTEACANRDQVCLPYLDRPARKSGKKLLGGCFPSASCTPGEACKLTGADEGICVKMSANVTACMTRCEISWGTTQTFSETCDGSHACVPVGVANNKAFACLYNGQNSATNPLGAVAGQTVRAIGESCSPVLQPCVKGAVCNKGICAQYCVVTAANTFPCPTGQSCCPLQEFGSAQVTGACATSCN